MLIRRGAAEAGAIFIDLDYLDGSHTFFAPAPQSELEGEIGRYWVRAHKSDRLERESVHSRMMREVSFDPDLWVVAVESREGKHFLDLIPTT